MSETGFNHSIKWNGLPGHPATHPPKITKIVEGDHPPPRGLNRKGWSNRRIWHIAANISLLIYYTAGE